MYILARTYLLGAITVIFKLCLASSYATSSELVPHIAMYSITLSSESRTSEVVEVNGLMTTSIERACEGWVFSQDMKTSITIRGGQIINQSALFTSWESHDGLRYRFASKINLGNETLLLKGKALLNEYGYGKAIYSEPESYEVALPQGTIFPVAHTVSLIDHAKADVQNVSNIVFTGSEDFEAEIVNVFIGTYVERHEAKGNKDITLNGEGGWPMSMAFYPISKLSSVPKFELRVFQLASGISTEIQMDFGDFETDLYLESIKELSSMEC